MCCSRRCTSTPSGWPPATTSSTLRTEVADAAGAPVCTALGTLVSEGRRMMRPARRLRRRRRRRRSCPPLTLPRDPRAAGPLRRRVRRLQPDPLERPGRHGRSGLPDVIAHGMLTMALAGRIVTDWVGDPGAVVEYGVRFTRPVVVPDDDAAPTGDHRRRRCARRRRRDRPDRHHRQVRRPDRARQGPGHRRARLNAAATRHRRCGRSPAAGDQLRSGLRSRSVLGGGQELAQAGHARRRSSSPSA